MEIEGIGYTGDTSILCYTDRPATEGNSPNLHSGGDWYGPDGTRVNYADVPGFTRNRGSMVVRLKRTSGTPPEGLYHCSIIDAASTPQTVYVGLYNAGEGNLMAI